MEKQVLIYPRHQLKQQFDNTPISINDQIAVVLLLVINVFIEVHD